MNVEERLTRLEKRQEALIASIGELADITIQMRSMLGELAAWLKQPPSSDLPDFLLRVAQAVESNTDTVRHTSDTVVALGQKVDDLPAELEKAVRG